MSNVAPLPAPPEPLEFTAMLNSIRVMFQDQPRWLLDGMNAAIEEATKKSTQYKKMSKVTLEIKFEPGQANQMDILVLVKLNEAQPTAMAHLAFTDERGRLFSEDPHQMYLPINNKVEMRRNSNAS